MSIIEFNLFQVFLWFFSHISYTVFGWLDVNFTFCVMAADLSAYGFHFPSEDGWAEFQPILIGKSIHARTSTQLSNKPLPFILRPYTHCLSRIQSIRQKQVTGH